MITLVIGGAGYLGSQLVRRLLAGGYTVRVLDNCMYGADSLAGIDLDLIYGDAADPNTVEQALTGVDTVYAAAGLIGDRVCDIAPARALSANFESIKVLVDLMAGSQARLVFLSSGSVYGQQLRPAADEEAEPDPVTLYAKSRLMADRYVLDYATNSVSTVLRLGCLFGWSARMRFDLTVNAMTASAVRTGKIRVTDDQTLEPHIHIEDVVDAALFSAALSPDTAHRRVFNVGNPSLCLSDLETAKIVQSRIPCDIELSPGTGSEECYSISFDRLISLGFSPSRTIEQGVDEIAENMELIPDHSQARYSNLKAARPLIED